MANLDQYEKDAKENALGDKAAGAAKKGAKIAGKTVKNKVMDALGVNAAKAALKKGMKAALKGLLHGAKAGLKAFLSFCVSNPVGWIILIVIIVAIIAIAEIMEHSGAYDSMLEPEAEMTAEIITEDGLTEDGVAILMSDCPQLKEGGGLLDIDGDAVMESNAKMLYSVFKGYGLSDECIAGILGNLFAEGSIDPTTIEGIYDEPHQVGPRKTVAFADLDRYTTGTVFPLYENKGRTPKKSAYKASDGKYYCGLGLVQWTGPAALQLLTVGQSTGHDWYSMEYQLAYMLSDMYYRPGFFAQWKENQSTDAREAAYYFADKYEGNTTQAQDIRKDSAAEWFAKMSTWEVDASYYESVVGLSKSMGAAAADMALGDASANCPSGEVGPYDNSSMAHAAVSYAYPTKAEGKGNNGTQLYQQVHQNIFPGDNWYMACDRTIACAIRWSGSDDDFPSGNSDGQYSYMISSPKWESVGKADTLTLDDLMPGDVFAVNGHVLMYVSHEIIEQIHKEKAEADANSVSGSLETRSPGCGNDAARIIGRGGKDGKGRGPYEVFRCVKPDNSETYKNAGASAVLE